MLSSVLSGNANDFLTPFQTEKHPHFASLLKDLCNNKLGPDFCTKSKEENRQQALKDYSKAKKDYDTLKLVVECIWEIISDSSTDDYVTHILFKFFFTIIKLL